MSLRRLALFVAVGVAAGVLAWLPGHLGGTDSAFPSASVPPGSTSPGPATSGPAASGGSPGKAGSGGTGKDAGTAPSAGLENDPGATTSAPGRATEFLPQPSTAASPEEGGPAALKPPPSTTAPLITGPLPRQATKLGALVAGYPATLAPPKHNKVETSSVSPAGTTLQVALTARCARPCAVLRTYRLRLAARGFAEVDAPSVENQPAASFRRGDDSVAVSVTKTTPSVLEYAVFGVLHAQEG